MEKLNCLERNERKHKFASHVMASPVLCLHEMEYLWAKCWTDQTLSVLELKIRWGRSFASLSLFMQWPCDCGLYGVIRNVVLGMRWTWALLLPKTFQTVYVLELWCEDGRDDSNIQGKSCEGSVSVWSGELQLCGLLCVHRLLQGVLW